MSRGDKNEARPTGMFVAELAAIGNEGWHGMKQLTLHFDSPAEDSVPKVVVTVDGNHVSLANLEDCCRSHHLIYLHAWRIDCAVHVSLAELEAAAVGPALEMGADAQAKMPDGVAPIGPPVLHFTSFREAKLREARLSFFERVLMHAKSLSW